MYYIIDGSKLTAIADGVRRIYTDAGILTPDDMAALLLAYNPSSGPELTTLEVSENGTYTAGANQAWNVVNVNVPVGEDTTPVLQELTVAVDSSSAESSTYLPDEGYDGFSSVTVNVSIDQPVFQALTVTENGTYSPDNGYDGFSSVTVAVPAPDIILQSKTAAPSLTEQVITADEGYNGLSQVTVSAGAVVKTGTVTSVFTEGDTDKTVTITIPGVQDYTRAILTLCYEKSTTSSYYLLYDSLRSSGNKYVDAIVTGSNASVNSSGFTTRICTRSGNKMIVTLKSGTSFSLGSWSGSWDYVLTMI